MRGLLRTLDIEPSPKPFPVFKIDSRPHDVTECVKRRAPMFYAWDEQYHAGGWWKIEHRQPSGRAGERVGRFHTVAEHFVVCQLARSCQKDSKLEVHGTLVVRASNPVPPLAPPTQRDLAGCPQKWLRQFSDRADLHGHVSSHKNAPLPNSSKILRGSGVRPLNGINNRSLP